MPPIPLRDEIDAPVLAHPDDRMLWDAVWPDDSLDGSLSTGVMLRAGGHELNVLHTPGTPRVLLLPRRRLRDAVLRRHAVLRRSRRDRPQLQRRAHDPALDHATLLSLPT